MNIKIIMNIVYDETVNILTHHFFICSILPYKEGVLKIKDQ
jgi:hypothetical protein